MDLFDPTQLGLAAALRGSAARQTAIAQNLANANTPGYKRVTVDFESQLQSLMAGNDSKGLVDFTPQTTVDRSASAVRADGSTVDVEREAAEQATNGMTYQAIAQVMAARIDIIGSALGVK